MSTDKRTYATDSDTLAFVATIRKTIPGTKVEVAKLAPPPEGDDMDGHPVYCLEVTITDPATCAAWGPLDPPPPVLLSPYRNIVSGWNVQR